MADAAAYLKGLRNRVEVDPAQWYQPRLPGQAEWAILSAMIVEEEAGRAIREEAGQRRSKALRGLAEALSQAELDASQQACLAELASTGELDESHAVRAVALFSQTPAAAPTLQELVRADAAMHLALLRAYEAETSFDRPETEAESAGPTARVSAEEILGSLAEAGLPTAGVQVESIKIILGGFSKQTLLCDLAPPLESRERIVVRAESGTAYEGASIASEFATARGLHKAGIKVPRPLALSTREVGRNYMVMEWADGAMMGWTPTFRDEDLCREAGFQLGKVHSVPLADFAHVPGHGRKPSEQMREDIALRGKKWRDAGGTEAVMAHAVEWLADRADLADSAVSLIHGDYRGHNILQKDGVITAILDWEHARIANPAHDLAYARTFPDVLGSWEIFLEGYVAGGGKLPAPEVLRFHEVFASVFTLAVIKEIDQQYVGRANQQLATAATIAHRGKFEMARLIELLDLG